MNFYRVLIASVAVLLSLTVSSVSQEAVEKKVGKSTEEGPTVDIPAESPQENLPEEKPARQEKSSKEEQSSRVLQDMMTAEDFKAAGLEKLSEEELKNLNAWLQGYRRTTETKAAEKATAEVKTKVAAESRAKMDSILSRVDGTFTGLTGHTIIKLEDGTTWKQANADDRYRAQVTDRPPVKVSRGTFGFKMRVVGTGEFYVDPVH
jgi:DNA polymerase III gamma/tau subunit